MLDTGQGEDAHQECPCPAEKQHARPVRLCGETGAKPGKSAGGADEDLGLGSRLVHQASQADRKARKQLPAPHTTFIPVENMGPLSWGRGCRLTP